MKQITVITGYLASLLIVTAIVLKLNHFPGEEQIQLVAGLFMSIYFPLHIISEAKMKNSGKILPVNYALGFSIAFTMLGITLKLSHLELGSLVILIGFAIFCLVYAPLLYISKSKEPNSNKFMLMTGIMGLILFPVAIFVQVYLGFPLGMKLMIVSIPLIFMIFLPMHISDKSIIQEERLSRADNSLFKIIIGALLFFYLFRSVYPPKPEIPVQQNIQQNSN